MIFTKKDFCNKKQLSFYRREQSYFAAKFLLKATIINIIDDFILSEVVDI